jgi:hypothetical protein
MPGVFYFSTNLSTASKLLSQAPAPCIPVGRANQQATRQVTMAAQGQQPLDPERPQCHVMAQRGWINDPNGPIYFDGKYHLCASTIFTWLCRQRINCFASAIVGSRSRPPWSTSRSDFRALLSSVASTLQNKSTADGKPVPGLANILFVTSASHGV